MSESQKDITSEIKKGEKRPASGNISLLTDCDNKRKMAGKAENHEPAIDPVDKAITSMAAKVGDCVTAQTETVSTLNKHSDYIQENTDEIARLKRQNQKLEKQIDEMGAAMRSTVNRLEKAERVGIQNSQALKGFNLVVEGVEEKEGENCINTVTTIFKAIDSKFSSSEVLTAYRIGQSTKEKDKELHRPLIVKLTDPLVKQIILEIKANLRKSPEYQKIFINEDLPASIKKERQTIREIGKYAHKLGYKDCKVSGSKLILDGRAYRYEKLYLLPDELQICNIKTRKVRDGIGFQGETSFLSNFYPVTFKMEQHTFSSAEQAFQFFKARTCGKDSVASEFLAMSDPRDIKYDGDQIPAKAVWEQNKEAFMRAVIYSKFSQNETIRKKLINTGDNVLLQCTKNRWWGCGLRLDAKEWDLGITYPGLNKTGTILMEVRAALKKKMGNKEDALLKSPSALIKSVEKLSQEICNQQEIVEVTHEEPKMLPKAPVGETQAHDNTSSDTDIDELMMETEGEDEESIDIPASSDTSVKSPGKGEVSSKINPLDITGPDGKLDIEKVMNWSIPKIKEVRREGSSRNTDNRTYSQTLKNTLPTTSRDGEVRPQAPNAGKQSRYSSRIVRRKLNPTRRTTEK